MVQPRAAMRSSHWRCGPLSFASRPPQTTSASLRIGVRISAGQFASSQARVSARKVSGVSTMAFTC